jgi:hypothetical protein
VDDTVSVRLVEGVCDLDGVAEALVQRQRTLLQPLVERLALEVLEHEVVEAVLMSDVVEPADVGVVEVGDGPGFALEALAQVGVPGQVFGEDLDCDRAVEAGVFRAVHLAPAPRAERGQHLVRPELRAARQRHAGDPRVRIAEETREPSLPSRRRPPWQTEDMSLVEGSAVERLREAEEFFVKKAPVQSTVERLARRLEQEGISYAVVEGMALNVHGYVRVTRDVDVLLSPSGRDAFERQCVGRGYVAAFPGARKTFLDSESRVPIEIITAGEYPGDGKPKAVVFPDPSQASVEIEGIRVVALPTLIELKLASGLSAGHRLRDLADVQDLILALELPLELANELDPTVREEYRRLWRLARGAPPANGR